MRSLTPPLVALLLMMSAAALFAASYIGLELPWSVSQPGNRPAKVASLGSQQDIAARPSQDPRDSATSRTAQQDEQGAVATEAIAALDRAIGNQASTEPSTPETASPPALDISRVSESGPSVFAGRADPQTFVTILADGTPVGTVKSDDNGDWSLVTEHKFASLDPKISFTVSDKAPEPPPAPPARSRPPVSIATADPAAGAAREVLKKFEQLVEEAREDARKEQEQQSQSAAPSTASTPSVTPRAPSTDAPATAAADGSTATTAGATVTPREPAPSNAATPSALPVREEPSIKASSPETPSPEPATAVSAAPPVEQVTIPVPIMFHYDAATLTPEGERAAGLLLEYVTLKRLSRVALTGHADERGSDDYNIDLSRERLDAVAKILRDGGFGGALELVPKGKSEPYLGVDRSKLTGEALYQLDRRVELRFLR